ncbi:uncharacterized protein LOC134259658 [Saccostrea cucullata]|uniref:uncharacterized protein LOC134252818 n=1 Tax=Saccostrea cuccullata TaxID=36930 RepID=UPI002ED56839
MPRKPRGRGREKVASSVTQDPTNPAEENPEAGNEHDEPSTVEAGALPSTETPQPDDPSVEFNVEESSNVLQQKRRKMQADLTEDQEQTMVEWLSAHPILYNKKLKGYKETQKKEYLWREQANLLGKDVDIIKTWYSSIRTRYGRLKKTRSGASDEELTERDSWILREFGFLQPHIIEVKKRTAVSMTAKLVPTNPEETLTSDSTEAQADTACTDSLHVNALDDSATTVSTSTSVSSTSTYSRASRTQNRSSDDPILADLASSREQLINLQQELLGRIKNTPEPNERDAFMEWVKKAVAGLNKSLWRRFQTDVQQLVSRYIDMQEKQQQQIQPRHDLSSNKDSDSCSVQWQPNPTQWPSQVVNTTSVWGSQERAWVQKQQFQQQDKQAGTPPVSRPSQEGSSVVFAGLSSLLEMDDGQHERQQQ